MRKMKKGLSVLLASTLLVIPFNSVVNAEVQYKVYVDGREYNKTYLTYATPEKTYRIKNIYSWYKAYKTYYPNQPLPIPVEVRTVDSNSENNQKPQQELPQQPEPTPAPASKPDAPQTVPQEQTPSHQPTDAREFQAGVYEMLELINAERAKAGVAPLQLHKELTAVAQEKSEDMVRNNYFSHTSPTYGSPFDMMKKFGISYAAAGENIAINSSIQKAHIAFMNSDGHRKNILNPNFTHVGIGIAKDPTNYNSYKITQMFIKSR